MRKSNGKWKAEWPGEVGGKKQRLASAHRDEQAGSKTAMGKGKDAKCGRQCKKLETDIKKGLDDKPSKVTHLHGQFNRHAGPD